MNLRPVEVVVAEDASISKRRGDGSCEKQSHPARMGTDRSAARGDRTAIRAIGAASPSARGRERRIDGRRVKKVGRAGRGRRIVRRDVEQRTDGSSQLDDA